MKILYLLAEIPQLINEIRQPIWKRCSEKLLKIHRETQEQKVCNSGAFLCNFQNFREQLFFEEHLWTSASKLYFKKTNTGVFCELFKNTYFVERLRTTGSEIPVRGSLFNKAASVTPWKPLTILERDSSTGTSLWILWTSLWILWNF